MDSYSTVPSWDGGRAVAMDTDRDELEGVMFLLTTLYAGIRVVAEGELASSAVRDCSVMLMADMLRLVVVRV